MLVRISKSEISGDVTPPPSKSYTHRGIIAGALSEKTTIYSPLFSKDVESTIQAVKFIGAEVFEKDPLLIQGVEKIQPSGEYLNVGNSGTTLRIFMSLLALSEKKVTLDGDDSLRKRGSRELIAAIQQLGGRISSNNGCPPITVRGIMKGGDISLNAQSSQYLTSLLFSTPLCEKPTTITVTSLRSRPYVDITFDVLEKAGIEVTTNNNRYEIEGGQTYGLHEMVIPADFSSASFMIAAGVMAGEVTLHGMVESKQGDARIVDIVEEMGGTIRWDIPAGRIKVKQSDLEGIAVDCRDIPDLVPVIAILGAYAAGETIIFNAEHLRHKESDRLKALFTNLKSVGVDVEEKRDGLIIKHSEIRGGEINSFGDHRIAMALSILGLISRKGILVRDAECVDISYPNFYQHLRSLHTAMEVLV
jgi:3-phosphoshikimate 1-carboxyvinyltransferase